MMIFLAVIGLGVAFVLNADDMKRQWGLNAPTRAHKPALGDKAAAG